MTSLRPRQIAASIVPMTFMGLMVLLYFSPRATYADLAVIKRPSIARPSSVRSPGEPVSATAQLKESKANTSLLPPPVYINTASQDELIRLKGIGPSKAKKILEYRSKFGPFKRIKDLRRVKGIGKKTLIKLRPFIALAPKKPPPRPYVAKQIQSSRSTKNSLPHRAKPKSSP